jgi:hypothetical protein
MPLPTPHLEKLNAILTNDKLPYEDKPRMEEAVKKYDKWVIDSKSVTGTPEERVTKLVALLNEYRLWVDVDLVFDSPQDFLYRQKGQLKLDSSIIEEFLPWLIVPEILPDMSGLNVNVGPTACFSSLYFESSLEVPATGAGMMIKTKDQDFAISMRLHIKSAHDDKFTNAIDHITHIGYIVAECKTNLDKTMFQEACATAHDIKSAVTGAHYFLLCEWLDMAPISTKSTDITEVIILRKAKRMNSNIRSAFGKAAGRKAKRADYVAFLQRNPLQLDMFQRFLKHIKGLLKSEVPPEQDVLNKGYF